MPKLYDDALKKLFRANAQDFVSLIQKDLQVEELLPTELDAEHIYADGLARCRDSQGRVILAHFEYQRENDERMGERLVEYNFRAARMNDYAAVISCVIYLKPLKKVPGPPFMQYFHDQRVKTVFYYVSINLGEIAPSELLAQGLPGLLPLLPLTNGGNQQAIVDIMIEELTLAVKTDMLWVGYVLASKIFTSEGDVQWLKGRFALMNDFLWDSPIYQELMSTAEARGIAKGDARGIAKGEARGIETGKLQVLSQTRVEAGQSLLELVGARYPSLKTLAQQCIQASTVNNRELLHLLVRVGIASTEQEAQLALRMSLDV